MSETSGGEFNLPPSAKLFLDATICYQKLSAQLMSDNGLLENYLTATKQPFVEGLEYYSRSDKREAGLMVDITQQAIATHDTTTKTALASGIEPIKFDKSLIELEHELCGIKTVRLLQLEPMGDNSKYHVGERRFFDLKLKTNAADIVFPDVLLNQDIRDEYIENTFVSSIAHIFITAEFPPFIVSDGDLEYAKMKVATASCMQDESYREDYNYGDPTEEDLAIAALNLSDDPSQQYLALLRMNGFTPRFLEGQECVTVAKCLNEESALVA